MTRIPHSRSPELTFPNFLCNSVVTLASAAPIPEARSASASMAPPSDEQNTGVIFARSSRTTPLDFTFNAYSGVTDDLTKELIKVLSTTSLTPSETRSKDALGLVGKNFKVRRPSKPIFPAQQQLRDAKLRKAIQEELGIKAPAAATKQASSSAAAETSNVPQSAAAAEFWKNNAYKGKQ